MHRSFPHPLRVVGAGEALYGAAMLFGPSAGWVSPVYDTLYWLLPRQLWGLMFLVFGLWLVIGLTEAAVYVMAGHLGAWATGLGVGVVVQTITDGQANSIGAPIQAGIIAVSILGSLYWYGLDE